VVLLEQLVTAGVVTCVTAICVLPLLVPVAEQPVLVVESAEAARAGSCGKATLDPTEPVIGYTVGVDIGAAELTPALAISQESSGIPTRGRPPIVAGAVVVGLDEYPAMVFGLKPHMPDTPTVPGTPTTVPVAVSAVIPEIGSNPGSVDIADAGDVPDDADPDDIPVVAVLGNVVEPYDVPVVPSVAADAVVPDPIVIPALS
jgi:hypothetical protein